MNVYYSGIGVARSLSGRSIDVYGLTSESDAVGVTSRFFKEIYEVPNSRDNPEALCQRLVQLRKDHNQSPIIFPTRDADVLFLHEYKIRLSPFYQLPGDHAVDSLLDKMKLTRLAQELGIPAPKTVLCNDLPEIEKQLIQLQFPLVVKPRFAYQWRRKGAWEAVGARKAFLVESGNQLRRECLQLASVSQEILIQEYISGSDTDIVVCGCYIGQNGELLGYFTAKKLRQNPPLFGTGCVIEAVEIPEIVSLTTQLLVACGYAGLAEVEFKYDRSRNKFSLIEVNPRHWDQHELGKLVGVNLTWIAYQDLIGRYPPPRRPAYRHSVECKWIAERELALLLMRNAYLELAGLKRYEQWISLRLVTGYLSVMRKTLRELKFLLRGQKVFGVFQLQDPLPGVLLCFRFVRDCVKIVFLRIAKLLFTTKSLPGLKNTSIGSLSIDSKDE